MHGLKIDHEFQSSCKFDSGEARSNLQDAPAVYHHTAQVPFYVASSLVLVRDTELR